MKHTLVKMTHELRSGNFWWRSHAAAYPQYNPLMTIGHAIKSSVIRW